MRPTENMVLRTAAFLSVFFFTIGLAVGLLGAAYAYEMKMYFYDGGYTVSPVYEDHMINAAWKIAYDTVESGSVSDLTAGIYSPRWSNIRFSISRGDQLVYSDIDYDGIDGLKVYNFEYDGSDLYNVDSISTTKEKDAKLDGKDAVAGSVFYTVEIGLDPDMSVRDDDLFYERSIYDLADSLKYFFIWLAALSGLGLTSAVVFLCCAAGHRRGEEGITLGIFDRIPYDIYAAVSVISLALLLYIFVSQVSGSDMSVFVYVFISSCAVVGLAALITVSLVMTTAARLKKGGMLRNTLVYRVIRLIFYTVNAIWRLLGAIAIEWRTAAAVCLFLTFGFYFAERAYESGTYVFAVLLVEGAAAAVCCVFARHLRRVMEGSSAAAAGDIESKIDTSHMHGDLRRLSDDINSMTDGLGIALEQRMKSERLKTELITNVSHDIKTPLTSIINYVDLLKKEPLDGKAEEYAAILEKHAVRLKKLTVDLVEASKAATGNIPVELGPVNVGELIDQAVAEYSERLDESRLSTVIDLPEGPLCILADGKLAWRVLDNLLGNAAKYSQEGTRLYISVSCGGSDVVLDFKNISRERLNIDPEELTERFVRGDSSRHTEGSGLGLNIAKSLTELQGGRMNLYIDGDLFKVELVFKKYDDME